MPDQNDHEQPRQDATPRPETVRAVAHVPQPAMASLAITATLTAEAEVKAHAEVAEGSGSALDPMVVTETTYTLKITGLIDDSHYKLYNGDGSLVDEGIGNDIVDAFIAMGIRLADGPDPSVPNN